MIISHRKKFAFFANQKTGSKAAGIVLRLSGVFDENDIMIAQPFAATRTVSINLPAYNINDRPSHLVNHMTPEKAIDEGFITLEQLREYDCYAFLREPEERFLASRAAMIKDRNGSIARRGQRVAGVPGPQYKFFFVGDEQVTTVLNFTNYDVELQRMLDSIDGSYKHLDMPAIAKYNPFFNPSIEYKPEQHIRDIQLYKRMIIDNDIQI